MAQTPLPQKEWLLTSKCLLALLESSFEEYHMDARTDRRTDILTPWAPAGAKSINISKFVISTPDVVARAPHALFVARHTRLVSVLATSGEKSFNEFTKKTNEFKIKSYRKSPLR